MRLLSIRLHPFGQFKETSWTFDDGMNVIEGPNEFGKSTLSHAIKHALFTSTQFTPAKMEKVIGAWYPHPSGTECCVTLRLEHNGKESTLEKVWSRKGTTSLVGPDGLDLAGSRAEDHLAALIGFNQATWECVFHTSQAALAETVSNLGEQVTNLDDIVASSDSLVHDVSPERMRSVLDQRIKQHYSNWDQQLSIPRDNRGVDKPWKQSVGTILSAYYTWKSAEQDQKAVDVYNERIDRLQERRRNLAARQSELTEITVVGVPLREQLRVSEPLRLKLTDLSNTVNNQRAAYDRWPLIESELSDTQDKLSKVEALFAELTTELADSQTLAHSASKVKNFERISVARETLHGAQQRLQERIVVSRETIDTLEQHRRRVQVLDTNIAAHTLRASITAANQLDVKIAMGNEDAELVQLAAGARWQSDSIPGLINIEHAGITIVVQSATGDVNQMLEERRQAEETYREALNATGLQTIEIAYECMNAYESAIQEVASCQHAYEQLLEGRPFAEWEQECGALSNLPQTRSIAEVTTDYANCQTQQSSLANRIRELREEVENLVRMYTSRDELFQQLAVKSVQLADDQKALAALPDVPQGYSSVEHFNKEVSKAEQELNQINLELALIEGEVRSIAAPVQQGSETELADRTQASFQLFERALAEGEALKRIYAAFERIVATQASTSPLHNVRRDIAAYFNRLTRDKYTAVTVEGAVPTHASTDSLADLDVQQLSRGTITSLALATRTALAEAYLQGASGVLMFDDPFVDMDRDRRSAAAELLKELSGKHQIFMFTCHSSSSTA